jgi:hypothetical protein
MSPSHRVAFTRLRSSRADPGGSGPVAGPSAWADAEPLLRRSEAFAEDLADCASDISNQGFDGAGAHPAQGGRFGLGWVRRTVQSVVRGTQAVATGGPKNQDLLVMAAAIAVLQVTARHLEVPCL